MNAPMGRRRARASWRRGCATPTSPQARRGASSGLLAELAAVPPLRVVAPLLEGRTDMPG